MIVPLYTPLSLRIAKRFFINHGFKMVFMFAFMTYTWNVWSESLMVPHSLLFLFIFVSFHHLASMMLINISLQQDDPFTIVGVSPSATPKEIRKACRRGSLALHPDKHPGNEDYIRPQFEKHTRACKVLNDDKLKDK